MDASCFEVKPGEGRLAKCLTQQLAEELKPKFEGTKTSEACKKELDKFLIVRSGAAPHLRPEPPRLKKRHV